MDEQIQFPEDREPEDYVGDGVMIPQLGFEPPKATRTLHVHLPLPGDPVIVSTETQDGFNLHAEVRVEGSVNDENREDVLDILSHMV